MRRFCTVLAGIVFFVSGLFKLIDPLGSSLIVKSYLEFLHLGLFSGLAGAIAFIISLAETLSGLALLTGTFRYVASRFVLILTGVFTVLTFLLLVFGADMDCGCFGEAISLSPGQSFIKNVVLCGLVAYACLPLPGKASIADGARAPKAATVLFYSLSGFAVLLAVYSLFFLPLWDFTSFSSGNRLFDAAHSTQPATSEPSFVYEKDGVTQEFTLDNLPDSTWTFVNAVESAVEIKLPENLLPAASADGSVCDSLMLKGRIMAVLVYNPESVSDHAWEKIARLLSAASDAGLQPKLLVACTPGRLEELVANIPAQSRLRLILPAYYSDRKALMTLVRSNCGAVYIVDGLIVDKWSYNALPSRSGLEKLYEEQPGTVLVASSVPGRLVLSFYLILSLLLSLYLRRFLRR